MKVTISGNRDGEPWPARGGLIELPDAEGAELCASGSAEPVASERPPERAVPTTPTETRTARPRAARAPATRTRSTR
jgi:hypothetical protein